MSQLIMFSYGELAEQDKTFIKQKTEQIKTLMTRSVNDIIEIGQSLIEVKGRLEHGQFGAWLETEFEMTSRTARNFMNVATQFKSETVSDLRIATSALYLLASPNTPDEARDAAIEAAQAGERVTKAKAKALINEHKPPPSVVPPAQPQTIASAPLAKAPKKSEEPSQARCKNAECDGFGLEWSRSDRYGVGLYCLDCIKVNKAAERMLLERLKSGEVEEAVVLAQLGCSKLRLDDKMERAFGAGWDAPVVEVAPVTPRLKPPITIKTDHGTYEQPELVPAATLTPPSLTPPKPAALPEFRLSLRVNPNNGRIVVTVGEDGKGPAVWNTGKFEDVQMLLNGSLTEFIKKQGEKYDGTALHL